MNYENLYHAFSNGSAMMSVTSNLLSLAASVLMIVASWMIFVKANEPGWAAIIPFYNQYVMFKIAGKKKLFWAYLVVTIVLIVLELVMIFSLIIFVIEAATQSRYEDVGASWIVFVLSLVGMMGCAIAVFIFRIFQCIGLANAFHLSGGYAVGLIFIPVVFYCIIAFNKNIAYAGHGPVMQVGQPYPPQYPYGMQNGPMQGYSANPYESMPQNQSQPMETNPYQQPIDQNNNWENN